MQGCLQLWRWAARLKMCLLLTAAIRATGKHLIPVQLGCAVTEHGFLKVDESHKTNVHGFLPQAMPQMGSGLFPLQWQQVQKQVR